MEIENNDKQPKDEKKPKCGIIMPISALDGCPKEHWNDVRTILNEVIESIGFEPNLVSLTDEVNVIQKTIIQNLYNNEIVVCDVSGKNANVMFELGIRLTFDRPTVIIKDDVTDFSFDTSPVEHLLYRRDLRYNDIQGFKLSLADKIKATYEKKKNDPDYSPFLKNFGDFVVPKLEQKEIPPMDYLISEVLQIRAELQSLRNNQRHIAYAAATPFFEVQYQPYSIEELNEKVRTVMDEVINDPKKFPYRGMAGLKDFEPFFGTGEFKKYNPNDIMKAIMSYLPHVNEKQFAKLNSLQNTQP